jgi:hypothetical protein
VLCVSFVLVAVVLILFDILVCCVLSSTSFGEYQELQRFQRGMDKEERSQSTGVHCSPDKHSVCQCLRASAGDVLELHL